MRTMVKIIIMRAMVKIIRTIMRTMREWLRS